MLHAVRVSAVGCMGRLLCLLDARDVADHKLSEYCPKQPTMDRKRSTHA
ncbi:hypothetical protein RB2654_14200 [Rhodobacterales bacterium HTCC2654]|uniref:Uncharacterized protein n=1 Tax=Maritimibacter alkaliphilus HTCC2654 TaxID=314271 RepID=A3VGN9_9RHOB|nr:hypothetical protein RB2654_14200 [Rhodobacterales bacterium HTCC2654] [Maritimibacter alkaliphilus HTCC2654]